MADLIHLLPDSVANQIAAGEVIQRPASVVKELVENAIDSGATNIKVRIVDAGKTIIQVIDNGCGMSETDARMAFERHATSKIKTADDLYSLQTMGFRGEALPSIAAVAQVELRTKIAENDYGVSIQIEGSKIVGHEIVSCPQGSNFIVKNLFYNIPARRKFLKSNQTEFNNIVQEFERITLAHPDKSFLLQHGDNVVYNLPVQNFQKRIIDLFGKRFEKILIPIFVDTSLVKAEGFVGLPTSSKKKIAQQFFLTNGRYMRHPLFAKAIHLAYERLIPEGDQIPFFISLKVDPSKLDVNVHPQKTEIKFEDDTAIFQILQATIREALGRHNAVPSIDFDLQNRPDIPTFNENFSENHKGFTQPDIPIDNTYNPFKKTTSQPQKANASINSSSHNDAYQWRELYDELIVTDSVQPCSETATNLLIEDFNISEKPIWCKEYATATQLRGKYIITQTDSGILIVDQHRAHQRILYEDFIKLISGHQCMSQRLLFPTLIQLSPIEEDFLKNINEELFAIGFDISPLGNGDYSILSVPAGTESANPIKLLQDILTFEGTVVQLKSQLYTHIAIKLSSQASIPYGQYMSDVECANLLEKLFALPTAAFSPKGKKVYYILSDSECAKFFE